MALVQSLLGGAAPAAPAQPSPTGDVLGSLLTGLAGGQQAQAQPGLDMGDVLSAGMTFLQSKQQGQSDMGALVSALMSGSQMAQEPHRAQSGALVGNTLLQLIGSMTAK